MKDHHLTRVVKVMAILERKPMWPNQLRKTLSCSRSSIDRAIATIKNLGFEMKKDLKYRYYIKRHEGNTKSTKLENRP